MIDLIDNGLVRFIKIKVIDDNGNAHVVTYVSDYIKKCYIREPFISYRTPASKVKVLIIKHNHPVEEYEYKLLLSEQEAERFFDAIFR